MSTFGKTTSGGNAVALFSDFVIAQKYTGVAETGQSMSIYARTTSGTAKLKMALYRVSDGAKIAETEEVTITTTAQWYTANFVSPPSLSAADYYLCFFYDENTVRVDGDTPLREFWFDGQTYEDGFPSDTSEFSSGGNDFAYSIYVTTGSGVTTQTKTVSAKARVKGLGVTKTVQSKARIKQTSVAKTVQAKARIQKAVTQSIQAKARILGAGITKTISAKAFIHKDRVSKVVLVSPEDESSGSSPATFVWEIPDSLNNENMHCQIQVDDTDNSFESLEADLKSWEDAGFEYFDGEDWVEYPTEGVDVQYAGNQARVTVNLSNGVKYWRVRGRMG